MKHGYYPKIGALLIIGLAWLPLSVLGQSFEERREQILRQQNDTRAEINVLEARIRNFQERVAQAEERFEQSYQQYQNISNLIALQDDKINSLQKEQQQIEAEITLTEREIALREKELKELIENYKKIILYAYKNGRVSNLELLVTAESVNQMLVRSHYLQKFEEQKAKQAEQIRKNKRDLDNLKVRLQDIHERNEEILDEIRFEKNELGQQRQLQEQTVEKLREERSTWVAEIRKSRQELENFQNSLDDLIAAEEKLRASENASPVTRSGFVSDETLLLFENAFAQAKGSLPWPVASKTVGKKFGRIRNPLYGTITEHPGIDIVTEPASVVRAVADGYVFDIKPLPGFGDVVFMKHGSFYTAYGNLSRTDVRVGSVLQASDRIGLSGTRESELGEVVFFLVRKGSQTLNPEDWLSSK